jgi:hypothetical protein
LDIPIAELKLNHFCVGHHRLFRNLAIAYETL